MIIKNFPAITCVEKDDSTHPYSLALRAYALSKAKASSAQAVIDQLLNSAQFMDNANKGEQMFWDLPAGGRSLCF